MTRKIVSFPNIFFPHAALTVIFFLCKYQCFAVISLLFLCNLPFSASSSCHNSIQTKRCHFNSPLVLYASIQWRFCSWSACVCTFSVMCSSSTATTWKVVNEYSSARKQMTSRWNTLHTTAAFTCSSRLVVRSNYIFLGYNSQAKWTNGVESPGKANATAANEDMTLTHVRLSQKS